MNTHGTEESQQERLERNWSEILQELRVVQTGTQILTGFLLTIPFQQRFSDLERHQLVIYLVLVSFAALATLLALAPVSLHRALFRQQAKELIVRVANRVMKATLVAIAITLLGTVLFIFDLVVGPTGGIVAGAITAAALIIAWFALPMLARIRERD